jgi:outer membrane lipoprotein-sorting protein
MKKIIAMGILAGMFLSACSQQTNCPAYGTTRADAPKVKRA